MSLIADTCECELLLTTLVNLQKVLHKSSLLCSWYIPDVVNVNAKYCAKFGLNFTEK